MDHIKYTQMHFHLYPTPTRDFTMSRDHHMDLELYEFDLEGFYDLKWPQLTEIWNFIFPWRNNRSHNDGFWRTRQLYLTKLTKFSKNFKISSQNVKLWNRDYSITWFDLIQSHFFTSVKIQVLFVELSDTVIGSIPVHKSLFWLREPKLPMW